MHSQPPIRGAIHENETKALALQRLAYGFTNESGASSHVPLQGCLPNLQVFHFRLPAGTSVTTDKPREATKTKRSGSTRKYVPILLTASCMDTTRTRQPRKPRFSTVFLFNENPADRPESGFDPSELVARLILINGPSKLTSLPFVTIRATTRGATVRERLTNPRETRPDRPGPPLPKTQNELGPGPYLGPALGN